MALKIKPADMERLRLLIASDLIDIYRRSRLEHYQKLEQTPGNCFYQRPELWAERYRWDVFNFTVTHTIGLSTALRQYLNDDDIYPVLYELLPVE